MKAPKLILLTIALAASSFHPGLAQSVPEGFSLVSPETVPNLGGRFYLLSQYGNWPDDFGPPLPFNPYCCCGLSLDAYQASSEAYPDWQSTDFLLDDLALAANPDLVAAYAATNGPLKGRLSMARFVFEANARKWSNILSSADSLVRFSMESGEGEGGGEPAGAAGVDHSGDTTNLWIQIVAMTNHGDGLQADLLLHNTTNPIVYEVLSTEDLGKATTAPLPSPNTNWISEGLWIGVASTNVTSASVMVGSRRSQLFVRARTWTGSFDFGAPTNGQVFVLGKTNFMDPVIIGATNHLTSFYTMSAGYWFMLNPTQNIYALNFGYDASDGGITNSVINTNGPQGVLRLVGRSKTVTNLTVSYNPLTNLNVSGWPNLLSVDAWYATNLVSASVHHCPQLSRLCLENIQDQPKGVVGSLDLTGDTNLAELRAAYNQRLTNITFAVTNPQLWHLCVHDDPLGHSIDFTKFQSLRELWVWRSQRAGGLAVSSTNLTSTEVYQNNLTAVDLNNQLQLDHVWIEANNVTNLNVTGCSNVVSVRAYSNSLPRTAVDSILLTLDQMGGTGGNHEVFLDAGNNAPPSNIGLTAAEHLRAKLWNSVVLAPQNPSISNVQVSSDTNSATITWTTVSPSDSVVVYGTTTAYGTNAIGNSNTTHSVSITGLANNTTHHFYVSSTFGGNTGFTPDAAFITGAPTPDPITFVSTTASAAMNVQVSQSATLTWIWGDNSGNVTNTSDQYIFSNSGPHTNYFICRPAGALVEFGIACNDGVTKLSRVAGLSNYPNLQDIYFYKSQLSELSLAGCSNLVHIALAQTNPSTNQVDQWFIDLAAAEPYAMPPGTNAVCDPSLHYFFYPSTPGYSGNSATARNTLTGLTNVAWTLYGDP